jgi:SAM-dependent methyltransferase
VWILGYTAEETDNAKHHLMERTYVVPEEGRFCLDELGGEAVFFASIKSMSCELVVSGLSSHRLWRPSPLLDQSIEHIEALLMETSHIKEKILSLHKDKNLKVESETLTNSITETESGKSNEENFLPNLVEKEESANITCVSHLEISPVMKNLAISEPQALALDVGCGNGRDAVFLARRGFWRVIAVDYLQRQVDKLKVFAEQNSVGDRVHGLCLDLEKNNCEAFFQNFEENSFDMITVARYLHRPQFPILAKLIRPGGVIVYHTFMVGSEKFGRPKSPKHLLVLGELKQKFGDEFGWTVIEDRVENISDGRPCSFFVAQKPVH